MSATTPPVQGATTTTPPPAFTDIRAVTAKLAAKAQYGDGNPPRNPADQAGNVTGEPRTVSQAPTATIAADPESLKRVTRLEADNLALKAKLQQLETSSKDAETLSTVRKLYAEGKKMDAIAMLANADPTQEMESLLAAYLEHPSADNESALAQKADELQKKIDAEAEARKALEAKLEAREQQEQQQGLQAFAFHALDGAISDSGAPMFELCARAENREDAAKRALAKLPQLAIDKGLNPENVTPDAARELLVEAYALVEKDFDAEAAELETKLARLRRPTAAPIWPPREQPQSRQSMSPPGASGTDQGSQEAPQTRPISRPPVITRPTPPAHTLDAVLAKNRERARY